MNWLENIYDNPATITVGIIISIICILGLLIMLKKKCKMTRFYIGNNLIEIWEEEETLRTTFPDGSTLVASPMYDDEGQKNTMQQLGHESLWEMCKSHEILHTSIAVGQGKAYSRGLWRAANGIGADSEDYEEEALVLKTQKLNNDRKIEKN